jgi:hypothetical protein
MRPFFDYFLDAETLELVERDDPHQLHLRILELLARSDTPRERANALVFHVIYHDDDGETRIRMSRALFEVARDRIATCDDSERDVVTEAIEKLSHIQPHKEDVTWMSWLVEFLRPDVAEWAQRLALHAISSPAFGGPVADVPELQELREAVAKVSDRACRDENVDRWGGPAFAISAIVACKALNLPQVEIWMAHWRARPRLLEALRRDLGDLMEWWS